VRLLSLVRSFGVALAVGLVAVGLVLAGGARASSAGWRVQPSPNPSPHGDQLHAVAATSATNAWAVGSYGVRTGATRTLIEHWDGKAWKVQPSPSPGYINGLGAVAATSSTNAWAVGAHRNGTLIEHWNGKSWQTQSSPSSNSFGDVLNGVAATSSINAWAVGRTGTGSTLIEHWDGTSWTVVPSPTPTGSSDVLNAVAATSPTNAWAVGSYGTTSQTLIEHWDGTSWTLVSSPHPGYYNALFGVAATSPTNAWTVGFYHPLLGDTLVEHWDGTSWTQEPNPNLIHSELTAVAATSSTNAWAVGDTLKALRRRHKPVRGFGGTLVVHWNGTAWKVQPSPDPSTHGDQLFGVAATSSTNAWAVGYYKGNGTLQTLIEHWNG
jgi:hypothetical protein